MSEHFSFEELEALSPLRKVPVLVHDGFVVPESAIILHYLDECFPDSALMPKDIQARTTARLLGRISDLYLMEPMGDLFAQINPLGRDARLVSERLKDVNQAMRWLDGYLPDTGTYAVGDRLGYADAMVAPVLFFANHLAPMFGRDPKWPQAPRVERYFEAIAADESIARVFAETEDALKAMLG